MTETILPQIQLPPSQNGSGGRDAARLSSGVGKPPIGITWHTNHPGLAGTTQSR